MLAITEQVIEDRDLRLVGNAGEDRIVAVERNVLDRRIFSLTVDRIDCRYEIGACDPPALLTLNAESRHHDSHQTAPCPSLEAGLLLDHVDPTQQVRSSDWVIAVALAFQRGRHRTEDRGGDLGLVGQQRKRRVGEKGVSGADRVDYFVRKAVHHEERARVVLLAAAAGKNAAVAEFEYDGLAVSFLMQLDCQRPHPGILVGEGETRLALIGGQEVEALEFQNIAPTARHLAVGDAERALRDDARQSGDRAPVEDAMAKIAEHDRLGVHVCDLPGDHVRLLVGDAAVVERIDLEQAIVAAHIRILVRRRSRPIDDRHDIDARGFEVLQRELGERVVAQNRGERDLGAGGLEMLGHNARPADEVCAIVEPHARRRGLGHPTDHGRVGQAIDDDVADDVNPLALASLDDSPQPVEIEPVGFHQEEKLLKRDIRRIVLDQVRRRVDDIAGSEQELAAVTLNDLELLLRLGIDAAVAVFVALGEVIGLQARDVRDRRRIGIDHDEIDHFERGKIERAQLLRHERPILRLGDVSVGGQAGDQDIRLVLGVEQVADMAGVHEIEHAMAHDHLFRARAGSDHVAKLVDRLDLPPIVAANRLKHVPYSVPNASNQVFVAFLIDSGSHNGASRQFWISAIIRPTPSSNGMSGFQSRSRLILATSAQVTPGSPGRFGIYTTGPPINSTSRLIDCGAPAPRFQISPLLSVSAAKRNACATSLAYTKSRRWVPSPTTVNGLPASFCLKNTPNTAPYAPVVRTRVP